MEWGGNVGKVCEWSKVARWERWENSEVAWSERWERNEVAIWERREDKDKIVLYCSREAKYKQGFTAEIS